MRTRSRLSGWVLALALAHQGCAARAPRPSPRGFDALRKELRGDGILYIRAYYETGEGKTGGAALKIQAARYYQGRAPHLFDNGKLDGKVEILGASGRILWAMRYRPGALPSKDRPGEWLTFRLPLVKGARSVRLTEQNRGLQATAVISRGG